MQQRRFPATNTDAVSLPRERPYDNLDWEWEIEHGVPRPPVDFEVPDVLAREQSRIDAGSGDDGASQIGTS